MAPKSTGSKRPTVIGGAPIEPVKIKVTPLRPLFKIEDNEKCFRGSKCDQTNLSLFYLNNMSIF